jgi:aspartyl-tRNA(Asn)/glutamyl-tRNA(Gln) amidotransferase subunit C
MVASGVPEFTADDVAGIAALARLELDEEERQRMARQLARILAYAEEVQRVDTSDVPPTSHVLTADTVLRPDRARPSLSRDEALANAPDADRAAGVFKVPRVLG